MQEYTGEQWSKIGKSTGKRVIFAKQQDKMCNKRISGSKCMLSEAPKAHSWHVSSYAHGFMKYSKETGEKEEIAILNHNENDNGKKNNPMCFTTSSKYLVHTLQIEFYTDSKLPTQRRVHRLLSQNIIRTRQTPSTESAQSYGNILIRSVLALIDIFVCFLTRKASIDAEQRRKEELEKGGKRQTRGRKENWGEERKETDREDVLDEEKRRKEAVGECVIPREKKCNITQCFLKLPSEKGLPLSQCDRTPIVFKNPFCSGPTIPRLRVSNTRLAQAASDCAPSVEVLPISDVKQKNRCGNTAKMHASTSLAGSYNNKRLGSIIRKMILEEATKVNEVFNED
ncbi:hypothetical protein WN51_02162 [Melipona quadrifasciata]|uniref:Uncharacterized protein n=1 Tax=Melipona quadrifasciata TaxID=166423 RepID=A0A0N0BDP6_9HYME|nr:hypothetical protein WN51_02162 [Melipona quadrifasciata]